MGGFTGPSTDLFTGVGGGGSGQSGSLKGHIQGTGFATQNIAESDVLPLTGNVTKLLLPNLEGYNNWINALTSPDPKARQAATATQQQQISQESDQVARNIKANLPRGGEQDYLLAENEMAKGAQISTLMNNLFTMAQGEKGKLGQQGFMDFLTGTGEAGNLEQIAANILSGARSQNAAGTQSTMETLMGLASLAAAL